MKKMTICRVCGYDYKNYYPWGKDGESPTYDICKCCGIEFGYEDENLNSIRLERAKWIENGMQWRKSIDKNSVLYEPAPKDYNPSEQLKNIPPEWI